MSSRTKMSKAEKEREKQTQDRLQLLLTRMLKDDDNKYCVDCDNKGPRWASWNLGLFLCIRCAGIHRNLGVHISKVKSVNLDSWTPQQVASMQLMGNSRARAVYEANLNDGFVRPQNDQALDQFIRAKYEKKKYIAKEYVPQNPPQLPEGWYELIEAEKMKKDLRKIVLPSHNAQAKTEPQEADKKVEEEEEKKKAEVKKEPPKVNKASEDILGLSLPPPSSGNADILSLDQTTSTPAFGNLVDVQQQPQQQQQHQQSDKKEEEDFFNRGSVNSNSSTATEDKSKMTKDSIMALFANKPNPAPTAIPSSNAFGTAQQQPQPQQGLFNQQQSAGNGSVFGQFSMAPPPPQQQNGFPQQQPNFGVNPQSNPFLAGQQQQNSSPSAFGNLQAAPASGQQNSSSNHFAAFGQVQQQFGGLNLGATNWSAGANPTPAANVAQPQQQSQTSNILGMWQ